MPKPPLDTPPKPGYPEPYATLLATLDKQTASWRYELEGLSTEAIVWQVRPGGHSIGALLLHLAEVESYWIDTVGLGNPMSEEDMRTYLSVDTDPFKGVWPVAPAERLDYYLAILDRVRSRTYEAVKAFGGPDTSVESDWGTMTLRWVLAHVIWHDAYHGGQIVLLKSLYESR